MVPHLAASVLAVTMAVGSVVVPVISATADSTSPATTTTTVTASTTPAPGPAVVAQPTTTTVRIVREGLTTRESAAEQAEAKRKAAARERAAERRRAQARAARSAARAARAAQRAAALAHDLEGVQASAYVGKYYDPRYEDTRRCIVRRESMGYYTVVSSNGAWHGAYQFTIGTAAEAARRMGRSDLAGTSPATWNRAEQDEAFWTIWDHGAGSGHWAGGRWSCGF